MRRAPLGDGGALGRVVVQAELGAAPEDVFRAARPFVLVKVAQLCLVQPRGHLRAELAALARAGEPGAQVAPGLHEAELHYLHDHEWARSADDVLWRRSKLGLHYTEAERAAVAAWCAAHWSDAADTPHAARSPASTRTETSWN